MSDEFDNKFDFSDIDWSKITEKKEIPNLDHYMIEPRPFRRIELERFIRPRQPYLPDLPDFQDPFQPGISDEKFQEILGSIKSSIFDEYFPNGIPKNPLAQPTTPPTDSEVASDVEEKVVKEARRNGKELVPNPLHPDNRRRLAQPDEEDFFERLNRGILGTGQAHRENGGQQTTPLEPDDF